MKKYIYLLIASAALLSCNRKVEFTSIPFVYFTNPSLSVLEDADVVEIPVKAIADTDFSVTFETIDGVKKDEDTGLDVPNGQNGTDYSIEDNEAGILRFKAGEDTQVLKVKITDFPGVLTGNKDFTIKLLATSGGLVSLGGFSSCKVTIIDNDHPLKELFGDYTATDGDGASWTVTIAEEPSSYKHVRFDSVVPYFSGSIAAGKRYYVVAPVSDDLSTISIPLGYKLADQWNDYDITIYGYDGQYISPSGTATFNKTETGYQLTSTGFAAIFEDDGYYIPSGDALATAPITIVKK